MRKKLMIIGLILLILAGFPPILRILGPRRLHNGVPSGELQIWPITILSIMALQSLGIIMGFIITVVGVVSPSSKKAEPVENRTRDSSVPTLNQIRNNVCG